MFNDKDVHKKTTLILMLIVVALIAVGTLIKYFPIAMGIISLCAVCLMVIGLIYCAIYMAVVEANTRGG